MKRKILFAVVATAMFGSQTIYGQAPTMGNTLNFVLFTSSGAVGNTGISHVTGNIGTQMGAISSFGNVDGVLQTGNLSTADAVIDLTALHAELLTTTTTDLHPAVLGTGETLDPGVYQISAAAFISGELNLDAGGDADAIFIFKVSGTLTTAAETKVVLMNNARACNVFWAVEGLIDLGAGTSMKGTLIANNAAASMAAGGHLEGRMFSTAGAVAIDGSTVRLPLGCGLPVLYGPIAPSLGVTECFALFTADGDLTNSDVSIVKGDVGTNAGAAAGFDAGDVDGTIHLVPNAVTALCENDLTILSSYLNALVVDIELLYPATLGNKLVLTPHTYLLDAATVLTDTLFLNAQNSPDANFVLLVNGALTTSVGATVVLMNGAQASHVYWAVNGNVSLNMNVEFIGTIVVDNGTVDMATDVELMGRALSTQGNFITNNVTITSPSVCAVANIENIDMVYEIGVYPNPFHSVINFDLTKVKAGTTAQVTVCNVLGEVVAQQPLNEGITQIEMSAVPAGIYIFTVFDENTVWKTGKLIAH